MTTDGCRPSRAGTVGHRAMGLGTSRAVKLKAIPTIIGPAARKRERISETEAAQ